jgi:zinc transport system substrate-binding protein
MRSWIGVFGVVVAGLVTGCGQQAAEVDVGGAGDKSPLSVYAVNYPLSYFAERIGGDAVEVVFPAMEGDPAYWKPQAEDIAGFQGADLILLNGAGYAKWIPKVSLPASRMVDTSRGLKDRLIELEGETTHVHGPGGAHAHGGFAFTTWLDPHLAIEQARAIKDALTEALPTQAESLAERFGALEAELLELDRRFATAMAPHTDRPLLFSHPVYQYFSQRYGLNGKSVHWEPDELPTAAMVSELKALLGNHRSRWMIWEGSPSAEAMTLVEEVGLGSLVFDPCGNRPATGDYFAVMRANVAQLARIQND